MNNATLQAFRNIADQMAGPDAQDWQWIGAHMSQRMFGITEKRAKEYAERHGGKAEKMVSTCGILTLRPDDLIRPCKLHAGHAGFCDAE